MKRLARIGDNRGLDQVSMNNLLQSGGLSMDYQRPTRDQYLSQSGTVDPSQTSPQDSASNSSGSNGQEDYNEVSMG